MTVESAVTRPSTAAAPSKAPAQREEPWHLLSRLLQFSNPDTRLWWHDVAPIVGRSLALTGYSVEAQYQYLLLLQSTLLPIFGPFPNHRKTNVTWPSCMAGSKAPFDVSVNYQGTKKPTFRITFEPIGPYAGTSTDPMNAVASRQLLQQLSHIQPDLDFTWYDKLEQLIPIRNHEAQENWDAMSRYGNKTQTLVGLDLHEGAFTVKAYFFPHLRAAVTGEDWAQILFNGIRSICCSGSDATSTAVAHEVTQIERYIQSIHHKVEPDQTEVGFDMKSPVSSRIKVYAAVDMSSLDEVYDFWTLGGYLQGSAITNGFAIIRKMWDMIYPRALANGQRRESMRVHCNWELSLRDPTPVPKAYFLIADETTDEHVSNALKTLFQDLGWEDHVKTHTALEKEAYPHIDIATSTDTYTWLSFAYSEKAGPYVTIYSKPLGAGASV